MGRTTTAGVSYEAVQLAYVRFSIKFPTPIGTLSAEQQHNIELSSERLRRLGLTKAELLSAWPDGYSDASYQGSDADHSEPGDDGPSGSLRRSARVKQSNANKGKAVQAPKQRRRRKKTAPRAAAVRKRLQEYESLQDPSATPSSPSPPPAPPAPLADAGKWHVHADADKFELDPAEISFQAESVATQADRGAKDNYPDILVSHKQVVKMRKPRDAASLLSWLGRLKAQARHQCFPLIGELKRGPGRCLRDEDLKASILLLLNEAESELLYYVAVYFSCDPHASSVVAVSGAGGYWRWAVIRREHVPSVRLASRMNLSAADMAELDAYNDKFTACFAEEEWYYLGTPESDEEWTRLRDEGLIPILEAHARDYPGSHAVPVDVKGKGKMKQFPVGKSGSPSTSRVLRSATHIRFGNSRACMSRMRKYETDVTSAPCPQTTNMSDPPTLDRLREVLTQSLPYCSGTLELPDDSFELFYGTDSPKYIGRPAIPVKLTSRANFPDRFIELNKTADSPDSLKALQSACEPAKFGRGDETVLDETYRKAGKMDTSEFMLRLDVVRSGILGAACSSLLCGEQVKWSVTAELYKLNVYGEAAFFKAHQDIPRNSKMFGSLVVVFPTPHSGGALVLRHDGKEWTFDSGEILSNAPNRVAYVAFFSDVEHEVLPVVSGHRVTVTYNLHWDDSNSRKTAHPDGLDILDPQNANANDVAREISALLDNPAFMPKGGTLGFRLRHSYPFPRVWTDDDPDPLDELPGWLKGSDAALYEAAEALGLTPMLQVSTHKREQTILLDRSVQLENWELNDSEVAQKLQKLGRVVVNDAEYSYSELEMQERVTWVTGSAEYDIVEDYGKTSRKPNQFSSQYVAYGNEASLGHLYMMACLTVRVGPAGKRTQARAVAQAKAASKVGGGSKAAAGRIVRVVAKA
ncbi:hypothetical protein C8T65DRAFT_694585 [Cerioporus squamosus]|nr:hypothetical protein C8T65DRAFT_694585 [Cerioporus squamosus]